MHVSMKWLGEFVDVPDSMQDFCDRLDLTGTGVEGLEKVGANLDGVVVGHVLTCVDHPDSDHMHVTTVDLGNGAEPVQIVCGAPNCREGLKVAVATIGAVLPGDIKIKKSKLRGQTSCGMLCSSRELGLGGDHEGILELAADAPVGMPYAEYLGLSDQVLDLEITPNRPDCLSMKGFAREVGAMYHVPWSYKAPCELPGAQNDEDVCDIVDVAIDDEELCQRYTARVIRGVKVGPSPDWMVERLAAMGCRSINNIVDVTNYILFELGQPLHAFDLNAFAPDAAGKRHVVVRAAQDGSKFTTLDGTERELTSDMAMITDGNADVALAGVMGGLESEVTDATVDVLLESATFSTAHTSRTSRNLGLVSEASLRYERGVDASTCDEYSAIAAALMASVSGGTVCQGVVDVYPVKAQEVELSLRPARLRKFIGADITDEDQITILADLGCRIEGKSGDEQITVFAPTFRPDLVREVDLYEEIVRIWGLDRVPMTLPAASKAGGRTLEQERLELMSRTLRACGLNETMTYSLVDPADLDRLRMPQGDRGEAVEIINPMSSEQAVLRRSIIPGLMRSVGHNQARGVKNIQLFERGVCFGAAEGRKNPKERMLLSGVLCGSFVNPGWNQEAVELDFFDAKGAVENLLRELCVGKVRFRALEADDAPWLQPGRAAEVLSGGRVLGWIGEIHPLACAAFEAQGPVAAFELEVSALQGAASDQRPYVDVPTFPAVEVDLAIVVDEDVTNERIVQCITSAGKQLLESVSLFDVYRDPIRVGLGKKSMAYRLSYRAADRTLTSEEVDKAHAKVVKKLTGATGGEIRG